MRCMEELEIELQAMKSAEVKVQVPSGQSILNSGQEIEINADSEIVIDSLQTSETEPVPDIVTQPIPNDDQFEMPIPKKIICLRAVLGQF